LRRPLAGRGFHFGRRPDGATRTAERASALGRAIASASQGTISLTRPTLRGRVGRETWGVFGRAGECGDGSVEAEEAPQGKRSLRTLRRARPASEHYVTHPWDLANKRTRIPHFDNKWRIEETVAAPSASPPPVHLASRFHWRNLVAPVSSRAPRGHGHFGPGHEG